MVPAPHSNMRYKYRRNTKFRLINGNITALVTFFLCEGHLPGSLKISELTVAFHNHVPLKPTVFLLNFLPSPQLLIVPECPQAADCRTSKILAIVVQLTADSMTVVNEAISPFLTVLCCHSGDQRSSPRVN